MSELQNELIKKIHEAIDSGNIAAIESIQLSNNQEFHPMEIPKQDDLKQKPKEQNEEVNVN